MRDVFEGKDITVTISELGVTPIIYSCRVLRFKQFLPKGKTSEGGYRERDLVQLWTDPGGLRTLPLASIQLGRKKKPPVLRRISSNAE